MSKDNKKRVGPPTIRTDKITDQILEGIAQGRSARSMCIEVGISQKTLWNWLKADEELVQQYARAKELCADYLAEEIIDIADDSSNDRALTDDGREITDHEAINRSRLRVDARKWYASKLAPKKYGDRVLNEHQGGDPSKPINQNITVSFVIPNLTK